MRHTTRTGHPARFSGPAILAGAHQVVNGSTRGKVSGRTALAVPTNSLAPSASDAVDIIVTTTAARTAMMQMPLRALTPRPYLTVKYFVFDLL